MVLAMDMILALRLALIRRSKSKSKSKQKLKLISKGRQNHQISEACASAGVSSFESIGGFYGKYGLNHVVKKT